MNKIIILFLIGTSFAIADNPHDQTIYNTHETYETYQVNQSNNCESAALSSAIGNNNIYAGARTPQLSLGFGGCEGTYAASVMIGGQACARCPLLNGSFSTAGDTKVMGVGIMWLLE